MRRLPFVLAACAALALLAGCGGSDKKTTATTPAAPANTTAPTKTTVTSAGTVEIKMQNIAFSPQVDTAKVGQSVKWTNGDAVDHNVTATKGASFKSGNFGQGGTYVYKVDKPGTITYVCTIHPGMTGTLKVVK